MAQETIGLPLLLSALEQGDEQMARAVRGWRLFILVAILMSCLVGVASLVWVFNELRDAWHTGIWTYFWQTVNGLWAPLATGTRVATVDDHVTRYSDAARTIREAAIRGDEQDAPVAQENSQILQSGDVLFSSVRYGPLKRPRDNRSAGPIALLCIGVCMAVLLGIVLLTVMQSRASTGTELAEEFLGGIVLLLLLLSAWSLITALRMRRGIIVTADESGITWKQVGWRTRGRSIAWHDARAFFVVTQRKSTNWVKEMTWVLVGSSGALVWTAPREVELENTTPHAQFVALVAARTRLPLRDLSAFVDRMTTSTTVTAEQRKAIAEDAIAMLKAARTQPEKAEAWLAARRSEQTAKKSGLGWGCTMQLVLVGVIALIYAGGWGLEQYQPHYYEGMLAQVHASRPLYHNDLTHDDGDWRVTEPSAADFAFFYADGSYHVRARHGDFAYAWPSFEHDDAAVEVTARQIGTTDYDGVGLALRVSENGIDMVTFYVDSAGYW